MDLSFEEALHCAKAFEDYFGNFNRIDEYMREQKLNSLADIPNNPLFPLEDDLFQDFSMHPKDMNFEVCEIDGETWNNLLDITSSHVNIAPVGRNVKLAVKETTTDKIVGFIRLGSPVINCKPRNTLLGQVFTQKPEWGKRFNDSAMMGFVIVPTQPFGYNYLGGKLLALICTSHEVREIVNKKYGMNLCLFETTSLYGSSKTVSQYDGLKPYIRYDGLTDSDFLPMMHGKPYSELRDYVQARTGPLVEEDASSKKLKISMKIISLTKAALKGTPEGDTFLTTIEKAKGLTEQKRYYHSDYGFKNMKDYINCKTDVLIPGENYEKHKLANLIEWWRNKAVNRYATLHNEGRLRTELEIWTSGKDIQIIR
jgi:Domain of unknown function (DUF4338)